MNDLEKMPSGMCEWREAVTGDPYAECPRGEWLLWYAWKSGVDRKKINAAVLSCLNEAALEEPLPQDVKKMLQAMKSEGEVFLAHRASVEGRVPEADTLIEDPVRLRRWHLEQAALGVVRVVSDGEISWAFAVAWFAAQIIGHERTADLVREHIKKEDFNER